MRDPKWSRPERADLVSLVAFLDVHNRKQTFRGYVTLKQDGESNYRRFRAMSNKTNNKEPKTRVEEFQERLKREDLERSWKLEALDHLFTEVENHPESFHRL